MEIEGVKKATYDYPKFLPHMSVCYFNGDEKHDKLVETLEDLRDTKIGTIDVGSVDLVKAILPKGDGHPILKVLESFELG
jgi:2'-5' RNA ligase